MKFKNYIFDKYLKNNLITLIYLGMNGSIKQSVIQSEILDLRLISLNAARKVLHVRHETVRSLIENGKIAATIIKGRYKIPIESIKLFIKNMRTTATPGNDDSNNSSAQELLDSLITKYS